MVRKVWQAVTELGIVLQEVTTGNLERTTVVATYDSSVFLSAT